MKKEPFILFPFSRMGMVGLVVLMLSISACNPGPTIAGADEPDPVVSDPPGGVICREVAPNLTNPAITGWNEAHEICLPESPKSRTGVLWVFLPGTGGTPDDYNILTRTAAEAGLHAITLQYPNDRSVNLQHCPLDPDNDCHEKVRNETLYGEDTSGHLMVGPENSITGRLLAALQYLQGQYPDEDWGAFLTAEDAINWPAVAIAGHSQGAGHAAFIAKNHRVHHAVLFAWVDIHRGELAPWLTTGEFQSPPASFYLFWHAGDEKVTQHADKLMTALDLHQFGPSVIVDGRNPPFDSSHSLIASEPPPAGERAHNTHVADKALTYDGAGEPTYLLVWRYLMTLALHPESSQTIPAEAMGQPGVSYIDPEFFIPENLAAFISDRDSVWLAALDPATGDFLSPDGKDILVDTEVTPLIQSFNGPEFGLSQEGWQLYYTKDVGQVPQLWQAGLLEGTVNTAPLTTDGVPRLSVLASNDPNAASVRLLFAWGGQSRKEGKIAWLDTQDPAESERIIDKADLGTRWIEDSTTFVFVRQNGPEAGQITLYDTETGTAITLTPPGAGPFGDTYGWWAPEVGQILVLGVENHTTIRVFQDTGETYWTEIATLAAPPDARFTIIGSPEVFTAGDRSYISLVLKQTSTYAVGETWVWGLSDPTLRLRCDDGQGTAIRSDPESFVSRVGVFIYYNLIRQESGATVFELYRCDLGLDP